jgi:hypothetical protein
MKIRFSDHALSHTERGVAKLMGAFLQHFVTTAPRKTERNKRGGGKEDEERKEGKKTERIK